MNSSLKSSITLVVSLLITALLAAMAYLSLSYFEKHYKEIISRYQYSVVTEMTDTIDFKLRDSLQALTILASYITPRTMRDSASVRDFFSNHLYTDKLFDNGIFILSPSGKMISGPLVEPHMMGKDYSFRDYFRKTVETGKPAISEPFLTSQSSGHPIIVLTAPVFNLEGKQEAILCGSLDLLKDNFLGRLANIKLCKGGYLYLFNTSRMLIVHHNRQLILKQYSPPGRNRLFDLAITGFEGTGETVNSKGINELSSFKKLKTADWILAANLPLEEAYQPIKQVKHYLLVVLFIVLLFSIIVVRFFVVSLIAPLVSFTERVRRMTDAEEVLAPIEVDKSVSKEIATLGHAFNALLTEMDRRKQSERRQLDFLRVLLDTVPIPVFSKDLEGRYIACNRALEEMFGLSKSDFLGKTVYDILPRELADTHCRMDRKILQAEGSQVYETQMKLADGLMHDLLSYKAAFPGSDGGPGGVIGTIVDISERRRAEFELAEHAEFAVNLIQNSTIPTFVLDGNHCVIMWNRACEELTGVKAYDVVGSREIGKVFYGYKRRVLADFIIDGTMDDLPNNYTNFSRSPLIQKGIRAERWFTDLNARERYIMFTAAPIENSLGELVAVIQTFEDITSQKLTMEKLSESEERMRAVLDTAADGIFTVNGEGSVITVNRSCELMFGYENGTIEGHDLSLMFPSLCMEESKRKEAILMGGKSRFETEGRRSDGSLFPVEVALSVMQLGNRRLCTGIVTDITERKRAEGEMQKTLSLLSATLESTADGILVVDGEGKIVTFNRKFMDMWNVQEPVMEGRDENILLNYIQSQLQQPETFISRIRELYKNPVAESYDILEFIDGRVFERYSTPKRIGESILGRVWSFRDVTEQRKLESQFRHSQKMEAIGTLAGGVAHDFNNMLTAIIGFSSLIQMKLDKNDPNMHYLNQVLAAAERGAGLTQSLLAYSRKEPLNLGRIELNRVIRKVIKLLARLIGEDIDLVLNLDESELAVMADAGQIEQVLMNLATNARDAMPGKGRLTIATDMEVLGEEFIRGHGYGKIGKFAHIAVSDTGSGMDKETMERIFEPFFTTKQVGRGTGLGLSMVYGIIKQHDGFITVSSEVGKGTTFDIYFPEAGAATVEDEIVEEAPIAGGSETILIVEDSPEIREMLCQVLATAGYKVIEAADGEEGVEKFIKHREEVVLVILDVIMPRKNGREAYEEIRKINCEIKAIFTSGYTAEIISRQGIMEGEYNFLPKPLSPHMILRKVRETLDA